MATIDAGDWKGRSLDTLANFTPDQISRVLDMAAALKAHMRGQASEYRPLTGRTMAMIFQKRSTRTRVSSETGFAKLGGHALFLGSEDVQLGVNESLLDTSRVLSRFNDIVLARVFGHSDIETLMEECSVPVINALSDKYHPLQMLADLQTLRERYGSLEGRKVAWVGDGNNIVHSILAAGPKLGLDVSVATPEGYDVDADVRARAEADAAEFGRAVSFTRVAEEAVEGADVVVTDTWISMGQEEEKAARMAAFAGYQVTEAMCKGAKEDWTFMHCLPRKPEEVDDEVFYGPRSVVWDEAENRMWTVMAVALAQLEGGMQI
jgi:ornithine carbamoyltransferase